MTLVVLDETLTPLDAEGRGGEGEKI